MKLLAENAGFARLSNDPDLLYGYLLYWPRGEVKRSRADAAARGHCINHMECAAQKTAEKNISGSVALQDFQNC